MTMKMYRFKQAQRFRVIVGVNIVFFMVIK